MGYGLQAARNLLTSDPDAAGALLDQMSAELDARIEDVRTLARELVPPVLIEDGLPAALDELAERYRLGGLDVELAIGDLPALPAPIATALYGIAVEAVRNVVRHSGATTCRLSLGFEADGALVLTVTDDGVGIQSDVESGVGLQSMRERAEAIGADADRRAAGDRRHPGRAEAGVGGVDVTRAAADHGRRRPSRVPHGAGRAAVVDRRSRGRRSGRLAGHRDRRRRSPRRRRRDHGPQPRRRLGRRGDARDRRRHPDVGVLVVTMVDEDDTVFAAMRAGARGYLLKGAGPVEIERALRAVAAGEVLLSPAVAAGAMAMFTGQRRRGPDPFPSLTDREREVLELVAEGLDNRRIATRLSLSDKTVRNHLSSVLTKLGVADRAAAIAKARDAGLGAGS